MFLDLVEKFKGSATATPNSAPDAVSTAAGSSPSPAPQAPVIVPRAASTSQGSAGHSVLGRDVQVIGSIRFSQALVIDGRVDGDINSDGDLTVGELAVIIGHIKTRAATIFGTVEGNITLQERCELKETANLIGDISAGTLTIEAGASFTGRSMIGKRQNLEKSAPDKAEKPQEAAPKKIAEATPVQSTADIPLRQAA